MTITERLERIEAVAKDAAAKVGSEIATHLPAIMSDPIVKLVEDFALSPAERTMAANVLTEIIKLARGAEGLAPAATPPATPTPPSSPPADDSGPVADDPAPDDNGAPVGSVPVDPATADLAAAAGTGVPSAG